MGKFIIYVFDIVYGFFVVGMVVWLFCFDCVG